MKDAGNALLHQGTDRRRNIVIFVLLRRAINVVWKESGVLEVDAPDVLLLRLGFLALCYFTSGTGRG